MAAQLVSLEVISRLLDLTPRRIAQLAGDGIIPRAQRGQYELVGSVRGYVKYLRERSYSSEAGGDHLSAQRARLTKAKADVAEMQRLKQTGELLPAAEIEETWRAMASVMRTRLLAIPARVAARVGQTRDLAEVAAIIRREVHEALESLSKGTVEAIPLAIEDSSGDRKRRNGGVRESSAATDPDAV